MFDSRYPIIAAPMNQVSYWEFAVAVHNAGAFPSISGYCYQDIDSLVNAFEKFVNLTGTGNVIAALDDCQIINTKVIDMLKRLNISHVIRYKNEEYSIVRQNNYERMAISILSNLPCTTINIHNFKHPTPILQFANLRIYVAMCMKRHFACVFVRAFGCIRTPNMFSNVCRDKRE
jgi:NAD(P)H-dependent flavin oxidoreductase YrpB (nitropropane dioxygenase family)